jgi:hypothetical protein
MIGGGADMQFLGSISPVIHLMLGIILTLYCYLLVCYDQLQLSQYIIPQIPRDYTAGNL